MARAGREIITLQCTECKRRNYSTTKNKKTMTEKMEPDKNDSSIVARPKEWWLTTRDFFRDTNAEMKKVTWPGKNEVVGTTVVVIISTIIFAVYLWGCDQAFFWIISTMFKRFGAGT